MGVKTKVETLISAEARKSFGTGFLSGMGGMVALPAALPAAVLSAWLLQVRMCGTIAALHGHNVFEPYTRTLILLCLLGDKYSAVLDLSNPQSGTCETKATSPSEAKPSPQPHADLVAAKFRAEFLPRLPLQLLGTLQHVIARSLLPSVATRGASRMLPLLGGVAGGALDAYTITHIGATAQEIFSSARRYESQERAVQAQGSQPDCAAAPSATSEQGVRPPA